MPSSKNNKKKVLDHYASKMRVAQSLSKRKGLKGGKSCPAGSQKVCIKKGDLIKLLKKASIKMRKPKKVNSTRRKTIKTEPVIEEKPATLLGSIFGAEEEKKIPDNQEPKPVNPVEEPIVEAEITDKVVKAETEEKPSFLGSIFGSEEKKPEKKPALPQV